MFGQSLTFLFVTLEIVPSLIMHWLILLSSTETYETQKIGQHHLQKWQVLKWIVTEQVFLLLITANIANTILLKNVLEHVCSGHFLIVAFPQKIFSNMPLHLFLHLPSSVEILTIGLYLLKLNVTIRQGTTEKGKYRNELMRGGPKETKWTISQSPSQSKENNSSSFHRVATSFCCKAAFAIVSIKTDSRLNGKKKQQHFFINLGDTMELRSQSVSKWNSWDSHSRQGVAAPCWGMILACESACMQLPSTWSERWCVQLYVQIGGPPRVG